MPGVVSATAWDAVARNGATGTKRDGRATSHRETSGPGGREAGPLHCFSSFMTKSPSSDDRLGDYTADTRIIALTGLAALIGVTSAFVALALVRLIGLFTNLAYFHRLATTFVSPADSPLGPWRAGIPVAGGFIVGLMARYGSEKIRGHGIPEALEAILIGRSRMDAKVAIL